ncbi:hypothetical protein ASZ90_003804 [hydrocarbon metagenome]|uniref:Uncharacterized protein n=1 Tax=hydrocarbon metagenome TaxID=938273 RepID=A0A0W8FZM8_9ZZZZ
MKDGVNIKSEEIPGIFLIKIDLQRFLLTIFYLTNPGDF